MQHEKRTRHAWDTAEMRGGGEEENGSKLGIRVSLREQLMRGNWGVTSTIMSWNAVEECSFS